MPVTAGWLCLLIGLADIIEVVRPGLIYQTHLSKIHQFVPGTLVDVTHTVSVIIGLLLLMLSHGLKRRKRRAWEAVTVLLAASILVHVIPLRHDRIVTAVVSALLVASPALLPGASFTRSATRGPGGGPCGSSSG